jgi:hypothetical protein
MTFAHNLVVAPQATGNKRGMNYVLAGFIGLVSGVTSGLFGVGGGIVMVPAMILLMHLTAHQAVGTSLAVIIPTALIGSFQHHRQENVEWRLALSLMPMAVVGGYLGARLAEQLSAGQLKRAFGAFLVLVGLRLLLWK